MSLELGGPDPRTCQRKDSRKKKGGARTPRFLFFILFFIKNEGEKRGARTPRFFSYVFHQKRGKEKKRGARTPRFFFNMFFIKNEEKKCAHPSFFCTKKKGARTPRFFLQKKKEGGARTPLFFSAKKKGCAHPSFFFRESFVWQVLGFGPSPKHEAPTPCSTSGASPPQLLFGGDLSSGRFWGLPPPWLWGLTPSTPPYTESMFADMVLVLLV